MTTSAAGPGVEAGDRWARSIVDGDRAGLLAVLDDAVDFRALTPGREWQAVGPGDVAAIVLGTWFAAPRRIDGIERLEHATVGGRHRAGYLLRATAPDGDAVVEQQAYFDVVDDRITWLRILCSGFRPSAGRAAARGAADRP